MPVKDLINYKALAGAVDQGPSIGSIAGQAFQEALTRGDAEREKQRLVKAQERKEFDADFGVLFDSAEGAKSWDASTEEMAREWKSQFAGLIANKDNLPTGEFLAEKHRILGMAKTFNDANKKLTQFASDYFKAEAEGRISDSTPANMRELANLIKQGDVQVITDKETGEPYVVGQTAWGEPIQMSMKNISSGVNSPRFNEKFDVEGALAGISEDLAGKNLSPEQAEKLFASKIEKLLGSESILRSIAADEFDINSEEFEALGPDAVKQQIMGDLEQKLVDQYLPKQLNPYQQIQVSQGQQRIDIAREQNQIRRDEVQQARQAKIDQTLISQDARKAQAQQAFDTVNRLYADPSKVTPELVSQATGLPTKVKGNDLAVIVGEKTHVITNFKSPAGRAQLMKLLGGGQVSGDIGLEYNEDGTLKSPTKRSALKRFTSWLDSMIKE